MNKFWEIAHFIVVFHENCITHLVSLLVWSRTKTIYTAFFSHMRAVKVELFLFDIHAY